MPLLPSDPNEGAQEYERGYDLIQSETNHLCALKYANSHLYFLCIWAEGEEERYQVHSISMISVHKKSGSIRIASNGAQSISI